MKWYTRYTEAGRAGWLLADKGIPAIPRLVGLVGCWRIRVYPLYRVSYPLGMKLVIKIVYFNSQNSLVTPLYHQVMNVTLSLKDMSVIPTTLQTSMP